MTIEHRATAIYLSLSTARIFLPPSGAAGIETFSRDLNTDLATVIFLPSGFQEPECQAIYYKEEYEDNDNRNGATNQIDFSSRIIFSVITASLSARFAASL